MINWSNATQYEILLKKSAEVNKPILLDLYSSECKGCTNLESTIYRNSHIAELITQHTLPLRVLTDNPDSASTDIINNHIYIWSPTVQLLASDGTRYHEWYGAPRQTRHSVGYVKTHHEFDGDLNEERFLAQFFIGLGKACLRTNQFKDAIHYFEKVIHENKNNKIAIQEANYWLKVAKNNGKIVNTPSDAPILNFRRFSHPVEKLISKLVALPDSLLMQDWKGTPGKGDWVWYTDCLRELLLQFYQKLCDLNNDVRKHRKQQGREHSLCQQLLVEFHLSYREFQSTLLNVPDAYLDLMPFGRQRSLRENIVHCILSEWWAHSPQIRWALSLARQNKPASMMPAINTLETFGEPVGTFETIHELLSRYEPLHSQLVNEFSDIQDDELDTLSKWWEPEPVKISFRLKRLSWHLHDHRVTLENILQALGHQRSQVTRFCQLLFIGLAKAESAFIGVENDYVEEKQEELLQFILQKTAELDQFREDA